MMGRRTFVGSIAGALLAPPSVGWAQVPAKVPRIGVIGERSDADSMVEAFRKGLRELGYIEGQNPARHRLPAVYSRREFAEAGGLASYGPSYEDNWRRAATYVDKILKGAKPAGMPVQQPTRLELVVNRKTANALGLTIPQSLLLRADEVIQ